MFAHAHFGITPASRPIGNEIAADSKMKLKDKFARKRIRGEIAGGNGPFHSQHALGKEWCELGISQDTPCGFDETGGTAWRCSFSSHDWSTASFSKAMDRATWRGILRQRISCRDSGLSPRQC